MANIKSSLSNLMLCFAIIFFVPASLTTAAAILNGAQSSILQSQQQQQSSDSGVSPAVFAELEESARLADIAYCVGTTGIHDPFGCLSHCEEFKGFELITTWNTGPLLSDSCGYIALSHSPFAKRIIVAFRGTYSLANTIVDLSAVPQTYVPYPADGGDGDDDANNAIADTPKCDNCTVHAGFWTSWKNSRETVLSAVTEAREQYPDYEVTLIGHSLGGAVAALAGLELASRGLNPQVTTFGEPRIGNDKMAGFVNAIFNLNSSPEPKSNDGVPTYRRVTHVNDPVPLLPLTEWGYSPHAGEIYISKADLPPSRDDLEYCIGNSDPRCLAGAEQSDDDKDGNRDGEAIAPSLRASIAQQQLLQLQAAEDEEIEAQWSLVPARYRIWELLFAHRDYFWRIGLCVPGGDPSSWRW